MRGDRLSNRGRKCVCVWDRGKNRDREGVCGWIERQTKRETRTDYA